MKTIIIEPGRVQKEYFKDLFRYRELFYFFSWRDILVRYKQAFFGVAWAVIRPLLNMAIFTLVFRKVAGLPSDEVSYPLFVLAGLLPWQLFSFSMGDTALSLINHAALVRKVYFPRMLIPSSMIMVHVLDFAISIGLMLLLGLVMGQIHGWTFCFFPFFILLSLLLCLSCGLLLSALTAQYRDVRFLIPFLIQCGMFVSPVGYGTFVVPEKWQLLYALNPMAGIIDGIRWSLFGVTYPNLPYSIFLSIAMTATLTLTSFYYFRKMERTFADKL
ncbi:MAG: ABC transporter permease [Chlamydiia bacterium]|nr:ABC transporter permease [Chlamydiia bacterium]